jgi:Family of unknown function (DUF5681)
VGNLKPWRPGVSGNPKGRPRGVGAVIDVIGSGTRDAILRNLAAQALAGDVSAAREILSRTDPAPRRQEISGDLAVAGVEKQRFKEVLSELSNDELQQIRAIAIAHSERIAALSGSVRDGARHRHSPVTGAA